MIMVRAIVRPEKIDEVLSALRDRQEMIAGELADLAGEMHAAIGEQDLGPLCKQTMNPKS